MRRALIVMMFHKLKTEPELEFGAAHIRFLTAPKGLD
jgi:hypothetical protein